MRRLLHSTLFTILIAGAASAQEASPLVGTWEGKYNGGDVRVVFEASGRGISAGEWFAWTRFGDKLTTIDDKDGKTDRFTMKLDGDRLVLTGGDFKAPLALTRTAAGASAPAAAPAPAGDTITGVWELRNPKDPLRLELAGNGSGSLNGAAIRWRFEDRRLTLSVPATGKSLTYDTVLDAESLTLSGAGLPEKVVLRRGAEAGPDRNLVGRWQTEQGTGFDFKADGTATNANGSYRYSAGGGTLYLAAGNTVYSTTYSLDGDRLVLQDASGTKMELRRVSADQPFAAPAAPKAGRNVVVNGADLPADKLTALEQRFNVRIVDGAYWYDSRCGAWGVEGGPTMGLIPANLDLGGGRMKIDASRGNSGVIVNGRELPTQDVVALQQFTTVLRGNFWLNADGTCGYVGNPIPIANLAQLAAAKNAPRKSYISRSWLTGIGTGGDGETSYVIGKDFSVMVGR
ncbi:MAG TPA: hypothetical protein VE981_21135 [Planctomycetota bacterium]|nr:hypothetical protein [Planctomycetota bacterium]